MSLAKRSRWHWIQGVTCFVFAFCAFQSYFLFLEIGSLFSLFFFGSLFLVLLFGIIARDKLIDTILHLRIVLYTYAYFYAYLICYTFGGILTNDFSCFFIVFIFFLKSFSPWYLAPTSALCTSSLGIINSITSLPSSKFMTATQEGSVERQPTAFPRRKKPLVSGRFILRQ